MIRQCIVLLVALMIIPLLVQASPPQPVRLGEKIPIRNTLGEPITVWINTTGNYTVISVPVDGLELEKQGIIVHVDYNIALNRSRTGVTAMYGFDAEKYPLVYHIRNYNLYMSKINDTSIRLSFLNTVTFPNIEGKPTYSLRIVGIIDLGKSGLKYGMYMVRINGFFLAGGSGKPVKFPPLNIMDYYIELIKYITPINRIDVIKNKYLGIRKPEPGDYIKFTPHRLYRFDANVYIPVDSYLYKLLMMINESRTGTSLDLTRNIGLHSFGGKKYYEVEIDYYSSTPRVDDSIRLNDYIAPAVSEIDRLSIYSRAEPIPYIKAFNEIIKNFKNRLTELIYNPEITLTLIKLPCNTSVKADLIYIILRNWTDRDGLINFLTNWFRNYTYSKTNYLKILYKLHDNKTGETKYIYKYISLETPGNTQNILYVSTIIISSAAGLLSWWFWKKRKIKAEANVS